MLSALTKVVVYKARPKPRCPLSATDNVTHSRHKNMKINQELNDHLIIPVLLSVFV